MAGALPGANHHDRLVVTNHGGRATSQGLTRQTALLPRPILRGHPRLPNGHLRRLFTDTTAPSHAQRFYRLRSP